MRCVVAFSAVGSLREEVKPRDFLLPDQVFDRTKGVSRRRWLMSLPCLLVLDYLSL